MKGEWPQKALGWLIVKVTNAYEVRVNYPPYKYWRPRRFNKKGKWGVSLSVHYIICVDPSRKTLLHEWGHAMQSMKLGWKYLFTVGIVSISRNIWDRIMHMKWDTANRYMWYYTGWPENEADKLGGVTR